MMSDLDGVSAEGGLGAGFLADSMMNKGDVLVRRG
jgi:hypothetical protein